MCRSLETSLATFAVTFGCMMAILSRRPTPEIKYFVVFVLTFTTMQLVDAIIWYGLHTQQEVVNKLASQTIVPVVLSAELLVAYYAAGHYLGWRNRLYEIALWVYVGVLVVAWVRDCVKDPITRPNADGNLVWCNTGFNKYSRIFFLFYLLFPLAIAYPNGWIKTATLTLVFGTWLWNYSNPAFGSRWCWSSNSVAIVVTILVFLGLK